MNKQIETKTAMLIIAGAVVIFLLSTIAAIKLYSGQNLSLSLPGANKSTPSVISERPTPKDEAALKDKIAKFSSEQEFKNYLEISGESNASPFFGFGRGGAVMDNSMPAASTAMDKSSAREMTLSAPQTPSPERVSGTNVQVLGIDEPDIIKTDGQQVYLSRMDNNRPIPMIDVERRSLRPSDSKIGMIYPYPYPEFSSKTSILKAFPPDDLKVISEIDKNGDLLLYNDSLIVFSENKHKLFGYNIGNPEEPKEKWTVEIKENDELISARLYKNKVYLVTRSFIKPDRPCPIEPFIANGSTIRYSCDQIYHPSHNVPVDLTYNLLSFDATTGSPDKTASFVGSSSASVLYMSDQAIYLTYNYPGNYVKLLSDFLGLNSDLVPPSISDKIKKIGDYDLSDSAKLTELEDILGHFTRSIGSDEMMRIQNEMTNRVGKFYKEHGRELENTGIVKIGIPDLDIIAMGRVPGKTLNQFSLDEYRDNLRVATTSSSNFGWIGGIISGSNDSSVSDVYVLDKNLNKTGEVTDLGKGERIYSVRFIERNGYVVTFKQVDPFYVLDLADPKNPELKGELKIPGYSSYLHPMDSDTILGVGQENNQVKVTLFDVSTPSNPVELSTYKLDEYYSEIANNHHAFLLDKEHKIFFIPGSKGAYVFSYAGKELKLAKTLSEPGVRRALYINNYLYVISDNKIMVLDESSWEKIKELDL